jgi:hypothetical protein
VRRREDGGAMDLLRRAQELAPDNARYAYVHAVALNSTGAHGEATALLTGRIGSIRRTATCSPPSSRSRKTEEILQRR